VHQLSEPDNINPLSVEIIEVIEQRTGQATEEEVAEQYGLSVERVRAMQEWIKADLLDRVDGQLRRALLYGLMRESGGYGTDGD
jgi:hypothetical protein